MGLFIRLVAAVAIVVSTPASATWQEAKSSHFIIYADLKPDQIRSFAERLERFDQAVRRVRGMADPKLTDAQRLTVYALRSEDSVARLAGASLVRGFYRARASGSVAFVPRSAGSKADWDLDTEEIFFHEYAHHLQLETLSIALPPWSREGFAEFFATAKVEKDGSVIIGNAPQYRAFGLFNENGLSVRQLVGETYRNLDAGQVDLLYGIGWLLTHYLTFEPSRQGQFDRYIQQIQNGTSALEAAEAAFGDLKTLGRDLEKYKLSKLHGLKVPGDTLSVGQITLRPLDAGEAAMMDVHIRSRSGVNDKTAPGVAANARRVAAPFPNAPFVQAALAEAEFDAGNYAAADAAADRALAANSNYVKALIYKGRSRMELARGKPDANWTEVRDWFLKANRLDTENAEPLLLYYQTYVEAGAAPTRNAVKALLYAVALVPQDDELRINAVRQMLIENRLPEARSLFSPLAFQPHATDQFKEISAEVMAAIVAGDSKRALTALEAGLKKEDEKAGR